MGIAVISIEELEEVVRKAIREEMGREKPAILKRYMDPGEIAAHFGVSRGTVRNWVKEGCPHKAHGKLLRFELEAVDAWFRGTALRRVK